VLELTNGEMARKNGSMREQQRRRNGRFDMAVEQKFLPRTAPAQSDPQPRSGCSPAEKRASNRQAKTSHVRKTTRQTSDAEAVEERQAGYEEGRPTHVNLKMRLRQLRRQLHWHAGVPRWLAHRDSRSEHDALHGRYRQSERAKGERSTHGQGVVVFGVRKFRG